MARITVPDVLRELRLEPDNRLAWAAGRAARVAWEREYGELPRKELRQKTNGGGSHCFATYPTSWRPKIVAIVRLLQAEPQRQGDLFDPPSPADL